jgi:DNA/RNA endonuclease G (NUC1)
MKRIFFSLLSLIVLATSSSFFFKSEAQQRESLAVSPNFVISQFKTAGATATDEFVELHNTSGSAVDLNGYNLVYRSAAGTNDVSMVAWTTSTIVPAGGYYLVATSTYTGSVTSNTNYNTATVSMSATGGGLAMRNGALNTGVIVDSVGYGTATNAFVEGTATSAPAVNTSQSRANNGCQDTDVNSADFANSNPSAPRNASSTPVACSGGGGNNILASGGASPSTVSPNGTTLLTVNVFPATTPPSTGITVTANLTNVFGPSSQQFYDDGTNGDVTAGDNTFSYSYTVPSTATGGTFAITAAVADAQGRTANPNFNLTISAASAGENPLLLGNPSNATADVNFPLNYLMEKPQFSLSYNRDKREPNWVAWRLDSTWIGSAPRQDSYRPDTALPSGWYQVLDSDYSGSGYDRGHMCPSGDRTRSIPDNDATFLMTNFLPQLAANNQGPWEDFETYCRTLASSGNEIYIFSGGIGSLGVTATSGQVNIPQYTWKVVLILPNGNNDLQRVTKLTRTIAIIVPNFTGTGLQIGDVWREWRTTIKDVEARTGYHFFTNVPINTRNILVRRRDIQ